MSVLSQISTVPNEDSNVDAEVLEGYLQRVVELRKRVEELQDEEPAKRGYGDETPELELRQLGGGNCAPSPCLQGGRCQDLGYTYRCLCPRGCTGRRCQVGKPEPRGVYISIGGGKDGGGSSNSGKGAINVINNQISVYGGDSKPCCSKPPCVVVATEVPEPVVVTTPVPKVETPAPVVVTTAAPKVETPAPVVVTTPVPKVETPAPVIVTTEKPVVVTTPVPKVETPAPVVVTTEKPVVVTTPVPKEETPAPVVVTTAEPIIVTTKLPPTQKPETPAPEPEAPAPEKEPEAPPPVEKVEAAESQQSSSVSQVQTQQVQLDCAKWQTWYADMKKKLPAAQFQSIMNSCKPNTCRDAAFKETYPDMFKAVDCAAYLLSIKSQVQSQTQQVQLDCAKWQTWYADMKKKLPAAQFQSIMNSCKPNTCRDAAFKTTYPDMFGTLGCAAYLLSIQSQVQSQTQQVQLDCAKWQTWYADMKKKLPAAQFQSIMNSCKPNTCRDAAFKTTYPDMFGTLGCAAYLQSISSQTQTSSSSKTLDCGAWKTWIQSMRKHPQFGQIMNACRPQICKVAAFKAGKPELFKTYCKGFASKTQTTSKTTSKSSSQTLDCGAWASWIGQLTKHPQFDTIMKTCSPVTCKDPAFEANELHSKYCTSKRSEVGGEEDVENMTFDQDSLTNESELTEADVAEEKMSRVRELLRLLKSSLD
ncbi:hypothetical protein Bbelb_169400 [Branchiostoma belcheri]|nr:hypothetical protein Bbelb_169400 [Branchiostoma belcheri]